MIRFRILLYFTFVPLTLCFHVRTHINKVGSLVTLQHLTDNDDCEITTSQNVTFNFNRDRMYWRIKNCPSNIRIGEEDEFCKITVKLFLNDTGIWIFKSKNETSVHHVIAALDGVIEPTNAVTIYSGDYALLYLSRTPEDITNCSLINISKEPVVYDVRSNKEDFLESYGRCGIRMKVEKQHEGRWGLHATVEGKEGYYDEFELVVKEKGVNRTIETEKSVKRNSTAFKVPENVHSSYCDLTEPHGNVVERRYGSCRYTIPVVSSYHEGVWIQRYYLKNKHKPFYYLIKLSIVDDTQNMIATISYSESGNVNLLCSFPKYEYIQLCRFQKPDGEIIAVSPGIVTDKYEYYGRNQSKNCGITIHHPRMTDHGTWKCLTMNNENTVEDGTLLNVGNESGIFKAISDPKQIYVKRGNSFKIMCKTNVPLSYCWLRSPNGTLYTVNVRKTQPGALSYRGAGLTFGECGAIVPNADEYDRGEWNCHMGVSHGPDIKSTVTVYITDSLIMAQKEKINVISSDTWVELNCVPIPGAIFSIDFCNWVKPDGTEIYVGYNDRYQIERHYQYCKLRISAINIYEDTGRWTCVVFTDKHETTAFEAYVEIYNDQYTIMFYSITSSCIFIVLFLIVIAFFACKAWRFNNSSKNDDKKHIIIKHQEINRP